MLHALTAPLLQTVVLGTVVLSASAIYAARADHTHTHRLVLHALDEPDATYLSVWRLREVTATIHDGEPQPLRFGIIADLADGCRWQATETLNPIDAHTYAYNYRETIVSCVDGTRTSTLLRATPRTGIVTIAE